MNYEIVENSKICDLIEDVLSVYRPVHSRPPYSETEEQFEAFKKSWRSKVGKEGFVFLSARNEEGKLIGFSFGWKSVSGGKFNTRVKEALSKNADFWLSDCFELVDFAVLPQYRGRGIGKTLFTKLFDYVDFKTALLQTHLEDTAASKIYLKNNWEIVVPKLEVSETVFFRVFGKVLSP